MHNIISFYFLYRSWERKCKNRSLTLGMNYPWQALAPVTGIQMTTRWRNVANGTMTRLPETGHRKWHPNNASHIRDMQWNNYSLTKGTEETEMGCIWPHPTCIGFSAYSWHINICDNDNQYFTTGLINPHKPLRRSVFLTKCWMPNGEMIASWLYWESKSLQSKSMVYGEIDHCPHPIRKPQTQGDAENDDAHLRRWLLP